MSKTSSEHSLEDAMGVNEKYKYLEKLLVVKEVGAVLCCKFRLV